MRKFLKAAEFNEKLFLLLPPSSLSAYIYGRMAITSNTLLHHEPKGRAGKKRNLTQNREMEVEKFEGKQKPSSAKILCFPAGQDAAATTERLDCKGYGKGKYA